jgi:outer membrane protein assembly factor BamB
MDHKIIIVLVAILLTCMSISCVSMPSSGGRAAPVLLDDKIIIVTMDEQVVAVDQNTGNDLDIQPYQIPYLEKELLKGVYGTPTVNEGIIYFATYNGEIYATSIYDGSIILNGDRFINRKIIGAPLFHNGNLFVATASEIGKNQNKDGKLYSYSIEKEQGKNTLLDINFNENWEIEVDSEIWSSPTYWNDDIVITTLAGTIYSFISNSGEENWHINVGSTITSTPLIYENVLYVGAYDGVVYAVDLLTGDIKWKQNTSAKNWYWSTPTYYKDLVLAASLDGRIYALEMRSGKEVWKYPTDDSYGEIIGTPLIIDGFLVWAAKDEIYSADISSLDAPKGNSEVCDIGKDVISTLSYNDNGSIFFTVSDHTIRTLEINKGDLRIDWKPYRTGEYKKKDINDKGSDGGWNPTNDKNLSRC